MKVPQVAMVLQGIRDLRALQATLVHPSPGPKDLKAPQDPKDQKVMMDLQVNQDQTVRAQSLGLLEIPVVQDQMEIQGALVTWGIQDRTVPYLEMMGTTGAQGARGQREKKGLRGPEDCQAYLEIQG